MISIIQNNVSTETDEEFNARINRSADIPKTMREIDERLNSRIQSIVARHYNTITSDINHLTSSKSDPNRLRFLERARDAFSVYLSSEEYVDDQVESPAFYILMYLLEDGGSIVYTGIDENDKVTMRIDGSDTSRATAFLIDKFRPLLSGRHDRKYVKSMLKSIFQ